MGNLTNKAIRLAEQIRKQYDQIDYSDYRFFDTYHDIMLYQKDGAWEIVDEVEVLEDLGKIDSAESLVLLLQDTLKYCKKVVKIQTLTRNLGDAIFG